MKFACVLATALVASGPLLAEPTKVATMKTVAQAADDLVAAIEGLGASTFLRIDQSHGAGLVGSDIEESQLIFFAAPADSGTALPVKVLVYRDVAGDVWLAYEEPARRIEESAGAPVDMRITMPMSSALKELTQTAAY
ncbi:hypothetical protein [Pseudaestuariivita sp.]|uniref:hypothetical protein n=1 Tax=Pseudaestuariivita sp. TaxID=2211669 RepID=UPI0040580C91